MARKTQEAALHEFFSSFGIPAFPAEDVPEDAVFPWLTYTSYRGSFGDTASLTVNVYYYGTSNKPINDFIKEIESKIPRGGIVIPAEDGAVWLRRGSPWCQTVITDAEPAVKRRYLNIDIEFMM